jgi:Predicted membrane protein (DUF2142)
MLALAGACLGGWMEQAGRGVTFLSWQRAALLLALAFLCREVLLLGLTPPLHAPDEQAHLDLAQYLADHQALPLLAPECVRLEGARFSSEIRSLLAQSVNGINFHPELPSPFPSAVSLPEGPRLRDSSGCSYVALFPPAYYTFAAGALRLADGRSLPQRLFAARATSICWGLLAVLGAFACGLLFAREEPDGGVRCGLLLGLASALQPMTSFLFASVNSDAAALACAGLAAACLALRTRDPGPRPLLLLAAVCALGVFSKPVFTLHLPMVLLFAWAAGPRTLRGLCSCGLALVPAAALHFAWMAHLGAAAARRLETVEVPLTFAQYAHGWLYPARFAELWLRQFWLSWGWVDVVLRKPWYVAIACVCAAGLWGLAAGLRSLPPRSRGFALAGLCTLPLLLAPLLALEYRLVRSGDGALLQGRYFLGLWPALALALLIGLRELGRRLRLRFELAAALPLVLWLFDLAALQRCARRYSPPGETFAHARAVFDWMAPGLFWPALLLQAAALALLLWLTIRAALPAAPALARDANAGASPPALR